MNARARVAPFLAPLLVLFLVAATHVGVRCGAYRMTRADDHWGPWSCLNGANGSLELQEGVPVPGDAGVIRDLGGVFRGEPGRAATGFMDERPLAPFLQVLLGAGTVSSLWPGLLVNLLAAAAATACCVDLLLRRGRRPLAAATFGCLFAAGRGLGCFLGAPDAHALWIAAIPIGVWLWERLELARPEAPRDRVWVMGLFAGVALLDYLGTIALLGFMGLRGLGRTPLRRLVAIAALALLVKAGWHVVGGAAGLRFHRVHGGDIREGAAIFAEHVRGLVSPGLAGPALAGEVRSEHAHALEEILLRPLVPAYGALLLGLAALGLVLTPRGRRASDLGLAAAIALPCFSAAIPHLSYWKGEPVLVYPASLGLALLATQAIASAGQASRAVARRVGVGEGHGRALERLLVAALVALFLLVESSDLFGVPSWPFLLESRRA